MTVVFNNNPLGGDDGGGDSGICFRVQIAAAALSAGSGDQFRVTFQGGSTAHTPAITPITAAWIGREASAGSLNFNGNQVQLLFGGSTSFTYSTSGQLITSDWVSMAGGETFDVTKDHIVSFFQADDIVSMAVGSVANTNSQFKTSVTNAEAGATTAGASYTAQSGTLQFAVEIEVQTAGAGDVLAPQIVL